MERCGKRQIFGLDGTAGSNDLHSLQIKIAKRAAQILKVGGGGMVYSTWRKHSFNPVENEAVVRDVD